MNKNSMTVKDKGRIDLRQREVETSLSAEPVDPGKHCRVRGA